MNIYSAINGITELMSQNNYNKETINSYLLNTDMNDVDLIELFNAKEYAKIADTKLFGFLRLIVLHPIKHKNHLFYKRPIFINR